MQNMTMNAMAMCLGIVVPIKDDGESVAWMGLNFLQEEFKEFWRRDEGA
jgi:hypothetical protein